MTTLTSASQQATTSTLIEQPTTRFPEPTGLTAQAPPEARGLGRDAVRLLVARPGAAGGVAHYMFGSLPDHLRSGDLVVVNNSATVAGQIDATRHGRPVVLHAAGRLDHPERSVAPTWPGAEEWVVELRTSPDAGEPILDATPGTRIEAGPVRLELIAGYPHAGSSPTGSGNRLWRARVRGDLRALLDRRGRPIAYGYLDRRYPLSAYQAVFSARPGSAEMPSAGRPFTDAVITSLVAKGVAVAPVTLHTGVSSQEAGEGPQPEGYDVSPATARLVNSTRSAGGRIVAVGTTVTRALESAVDHRGRVAPGSGWTRRVVTPLQPPAVVDGLITGWHDPHASHLLLVEAVAGPRLAQEAYDAAVAGRYHWHEFGDTALFLP